MKAFFASRAGTIFVVGLLCLGAGGCAQMPAVSAPMSGPVSGLASGPISEPASGLGSAPASGPASAPTARTEATCAASALDLPLEALYGPWQARLEGEAAPAQLTLERHPDYPGVRGRIVQAGAPGVAARSAELAGDIDDQAMLSLDESADGRTISGVWLGEMEPGSCGRAFRGVRRDAALQTNRSFTLTRPVQP